MKKIFLKFIYIFLIFFAYLFFVQNTLAFQFEKSPDNPLPVSYINDYAYQLQTNIFKEGDLYRSIFVIKRPQETDYSLGYFESVNGVDWIMKKEILNTGADLSNPSIIKTKTGYVLFITRHENNTVYEIYSSICDFDFNCSADFSRVIMPDLSNYSENNGVFAGHPFQQDNRTYLFFGAWGGDGFKIKLAYSDDLITWVRCPNDKAFLYGSDGPFPYSENNDLYLFFHRSDSSGIELAKSVLPLTCDSVFEDQGYLLIRDKSYDQKHLVFPSVLNDNGGLKLYYSGLGSDSRWKLNLACTGQTCLSPTATSTPIPIPTSISEKIPVIIIPGMMASWNKKAILHNQTVDYSAWKLQSFVKDYDGLIDTLKNIGYQENTNLFLFPYDWRQSIDKTKDDLKSFLQTKIWNNQPDQRVNLVGHSLGGLIARIFSQSYKEKISQIITAASPHQGVVQVYKPLEGGEIDRDNTFLWLAEKIVLILNKSTVESDRVTIANKFPAVKDLFPTFNFLKDSSGNLIPIGSMSIKNNFLDSYNQTFSEIFPMFTAIYGEKNKQTPSGFIVQSADTFNQLFGNYPDGQPKSSLYDAGDYTVLSSSANQDQDSIKLNFDHQEIITKKEGIKKILDVLKIIYSDDQIIEGKKTIISPSLIFLIKSPAVMTVKFNDSMYIEDEGIIFIPDARSGGYDLNVQGVDQGKYEVIVGQISENNDVWDSIYGETTASQTDNYNILYNNQTAFSIFPTPTLAAEVLTKEAPMITGQVNLSPTEEPIPIPIQPAPGVFGISSNEKEFVSPTIKIIKQAEVKKEIKKSSIWDYIWPLVALLILGRIGWVFRKKFKKLFEN